MLNLGIGLGLSGGAGGAGVVLGASEFYAPLTHSLVLTRGTGSATYTRATKAWEFGYAAAANAGADQVLIEVATGTPRFGGARYDSGTWYNTYADGSAISASSLLGYHAEGARTNSLLYSRDLTKLASGYSGGQVFWVPGTVGAELVTNGHFTSDTSGWVAGYGNVAATFVASGGQATLTLTPADSHGEYKTTVTGLTVGRVYLVTLDTISLSGGDFYITEGGIGSGGGQIGFSTNKKYLCFTATSTSRIISIYINNTAFVSRTVVVDNISVKEAAIQVTTCTGLDNAANSASTLTAGAANATILQTLTLAAAARSFSAYVKRRTGTGNVYITRDGGTNWTDITSLINSSTWTRVKIENTSVLNPQVGFKIATSGDAIDVDVCQDEAGAKASSPIITTTAAVTRNSDALLYDSANIVGTVGSLIANINSDIKSQGTYATPVIDTYSGAGKGIPLNINTTGALSSFDGSNYRESGLNVGVGNYTGKLGFVWNGASGKHVSNGTVSALTAALDGDLSIGTSMGIGCEPNATQVNLYGYIKDTYIWQSALTDAQLQQVTT